MYALYHTDSHYHPYWKHRLQKKIVTFRNTEINFREKSVH